MDGSIIKEVEPDKRETGTSRGNGGSGGSAKSTSTTDTRTRTGGTGGTGTGGTGGKTTDKEQKVISTVVNVEEQKRLERNAKRRERYQKQKAEGTLKPKKVNTKKTKEVIETSQIETLIKTISVMVSSRQGQEHWLLLDSEVKAISEPLTNILKDSNAFNSISEHSNAVALVIACITIILPRTIKSITDISKKKKKEKEVLNNELRRSKTKNITNDKRNNGNTSTNDKNNGTNAIWYGDAINL